MAKIVAITGCVTGIAHTLMAAEALRKTAKVMGHDIKVETLNTDGANRQELTPADIASADVAIVASDVFVDVKRFAGKPLYAVPVAEAIRKTRAVIEAALAELPQPIGEPLPPEPSPAVAPARCRSSPAVPNVYRPVPTGTKSMPLHSTRSGHWRELLTT